jgi:hypothetical protein
VFWHMKAKLHDQMQRTLAWWRLWFGNSCHITTVLITNHPLTYIPANHLLVLTHIAYIPDCVYLNLQYKNTGHLKSLIHCNTTIYSWSKFWVVGGSSWMLPWYE